MITTDSGQVDRLKDCVGALETEVADARTALEKAKAAAVKQVEAARGSQAGSCSGS